MDPPQCVTKTELWAVCPSHCDRGKNVIRGGAAVLYHVASESRGALSPPIGHHGHHSGCQTWRKMAKNIWHAGLEVSGLWDIWTQRWFCHTIRVFVIYSVYNRARCSTVVSRQHSWSNMWLNSCSLTCRCVGRFVASKTAFISSKILILNTTNNL